jgi:hypothetical protein
MLNLETYSLIPISFTRRRQYRLIGVFDQNRSQYTRLRACILLANVVQVQIGVQDQNLEEFSRILLVNY